MLILQKPTEEMTLKEIREYVSPHLSEESRMEDHYQIFLEVAKVLSEEFGMSSDDILNAKRMRDEIERASGLIENLKESIESAILAVEDDPDEAIEELKELKECDIFEWKETVDKEILK